MERYGMTPRKKQHNIWHKELVLLLIDITWCEKCGIQVGPNGDKAHRKKRYDIGWKTEEDHQEYLMAARLCRECHKGLDENYNKDKDPNFDAHQIMFDTITDLINKRYA